MIVIYTYIYFKLREKEIPDWSRTKENGGPYSQPGFDRRGGVPGQPGHGPLLVAPLPHDRGLCISHGAGQPKDLSIKMV